MAGDPAWALRGAERGIAVDPGFSFVFLGTYQRLARCWALAVTGDDPAAAPSEAERIIAATCSTRRARASPPGTGCSARCTGCRVTDEAAAALDRADLYLDAYGQRYPEGLLLLLRAQLLQARGEPAAVVRAAAERARALSTEREAHLFVRSAEEFLTIDTMRIRQRIHKVSTGRKDAPDRLNSEPAGCEKTLWSVLSGGIMQMRAARIHGYNEPLQLERSRSPPPERTRC